MVARELLGRPALAVLLVVEVAQAAVRVAVGNVDKGAIVVVVAVFLFAVEGRGPRYLDVADVVLALVAVVVDLHLRLGGGGCRGQHGDGGGGNGGEVHDAGVY